MNENKTKIMSIIRISLSFIAMIVVILNMLEIIPSNISLMIALICVGIVTIWNGVEAIKSGRIKSAVFNFVLIGILLLLTLTGIFL